MEFTVKRTLDDGQRVQFRIQTDTREDAEKYVASCNRMFTGAFELWG